MSAHPARRLWWALEPLHAVTYFADECRAAQAEQGMKGFWMGYFAFRAAPLGPVGPAPVEAIFAGFRPQMVARALPDAWDHASPEECLTARRRAAAGVLGRLGIGDDLAGTVAGILEPVAAGATVTGRPLAAANRALALPDDPVERLWQLATTLREHRGDGHVAVLAAEGLSGLDAHLLHVAAGEAAWGARGWTDEERAEGEESLRGRGLLDAGGALTPAAVALRARVEARTDEVSWTGGAGALGDGGVERVAALVREAVEAAASVVQFPNPMGLPAPG